MTLVYPSLALHVAGQWIGHTSGGSLPVINPATATELGLLPLAGPTELAAAAESAQRGFLAWRRVRPHERYVVLRRAAELLRLTFRPSSARLNDWPDLLAAALAADPGLGLAEWADRMGIAPQSLSRGFRRAFGTSPKRYRLELRAQHALHRLPGWQGSMAALAAETGFADQAHLTRALVDLTGLTPGRLAG